jgi:hypothetical protein
VLHKFIIDAMTPAAINKGILAHDRIDLATAHILDLPREQRVAMAALVASLRKQHEDGHPLEVNLHRLTVVRDTPIRRAFLDLIEATTFLDSVGVSVKPAIRPVLAMLRDATTLSPAQAFVMGKSAPVIKAAMEDLLRISGSLDPDVLSLQPLIDVFRRVEQSLPPRIDECFSVLFRCNVTQDSRAALVGSFQAMTRFVGAVCDRILICEKHLRSPLNPSQPAGATGCAAPARKKQTTGSAFDDSSVGADECVACFGGSDSESAVFEVDIRRRPLSSAVVNGATLIRNLFESALMDEARTRGVLEDPAPPFSVECFGHSVVRIRGQWQGAAGYASAKEFAQYVIRVAYKAIILLEDVDVAWDQVRDVTDVRFETAAAIFDAVVVFDSDRCPQLRPDNDALSFFGSRPMFRRTCFFHGKGADDSISGDTPRCRKASNVQPKCRLGPGLMVFNCEHRVLYGFVVQERFESPRFAFDAFRQFWPFSPEEIIYDLSCTLHRYCISRNPSFFKDCRFYLDRFHEPNHTGCSWTYKSPNDGRHFVNTQASVV